MRDPRATWKLQLRTFGIYRCTCALSRLLSISPAQTDSLRLTASQSGREGFNMCQSQTCVLYCCSYHAGHAWPHTHTHTLAYLSGNFHWDNSLASSQPEPNPSQLSPEPWPKPIRSSNFKQYLKPQTVLSSCEAQQNGLTPQKCPHFASKMRIFGAQYVVNVRTDTQIHINRAAQNSLIISWMFKQLNRTDENETNVHRLSEIILGSIYKWTCVVMGNARHDRSC